MSLFVYVLQAVSFPPASTGRFLGVAGKYALQYALLFPKSKKKIYASENLRSPQEISSVNDHTVIVDNYILFL